MVAVQCVARACSSSAHTHTHTRTHTHARAMAILSLAVKLSGFGVGYVYPVYCSLKLLDRKSNTQDDYVLWLTYMIIAFTMVIAESWGIVLWYVLCVVWCAVSCSGDGWRATLTRVDARILPERAARIRRLEPFLRAHSRVFPRVAFENTRDRHCFPDFRTHSFGVLVVMCFLARICI